MIFKKNPRQINHACKQQSSKKPPEHPHPVNETLQEPLGRVNPSTHLLLVLGEDSKERQAFHQAGYWRFKQLIRLWGRLVGWLTYSGVWVQDVACLPSPSKAPALNTSVEALLWLFAQDIHWNWSSMSPDFSHNIREGFLGEPFLA